jgi:hypothetical protein
MCSTQPDVTGMMFQGEERAWSLVVGNFDIVAVRAFYRPLLIKALIKASLSCGRKLRKYLKGVVE